MSTSPSWFDQEKFSRLVKKVGPKNLSEPPPATPAPAPSPTGSQALPPAPSAPAPLASQPLPPATSPTGSQPLPPAPSDSQRLPEGPAGEASENIVSTARISLASKPPSLLSEQRSLPALPRRTTPLPGLKSLFQSPAQEKPATVPLPPAPTPPAAVEMPSVITQPLPETQPSPAPEKPELEPPASVAPPKRVDMAAVGDDDLSEIWQKMALLNEELAQTIQERDHALGDINTLREQMRVIEENLARSHGSVTSDDLAQIARERDEALAELKALKANPPRGDSQRIQLPDGVTKTKELIFLTQERDQARKEYVELRKQFEGLKREQAPPAPPPLPRDDVAKVRKELEQQLDGFRLKLEEKNKEIAALKAAPPSAAPPPLPVPASSENEDKLKAEIAALKEQVAKLKEDASIAQRGLALSQKALQETRDTLREATEGTSLSRHNFDNLKNECASLTQQNTVLQAQNEQLSRELAAAKSQRQSGRLPS
jgi:hypothetical protein